jgi:hypothetical protein
VKKTIIIIVGAVMFVVVIGLLLSSLLERRTYHATGRLTLVLGTNDLYDPYFIQKQIQTMSNFLTSHDSRLKLATQCNVDESSFRLVEIGPVRGTKLVYIHYSGVESNSVQYVASNAATMVVGFFTTNQLPWEIAYVDSSCFTPRSFLENVWIYLKNL